MNQPFRNICARPLAAALLNLLLVFQLFAQAPASAVAVKPSLASVEAELAEKITVQSIKDMTAALAAPEMEGRGTGQPGGDKAAGWIAEKFKSFGMKPLGDKGTFLQKVEFRETAVAADASLTVGDQALVHGSDFASSRKTAATRMFPAIWSTSPTVFRRNNRTSICLKAPILQARSLS